MSEPRPLHRLFGLSWVDFFQGTSVTVSTEVDLSVKQQFLDLVMSRPGLEPIPKPLPDGFEDLGPHNLVTFKSHQEALDGLALCELVGHYVNYLKRVSPALDDLLPESDFRLFAVCVRSPQKLAQQMPLVSMREGVYEARVAHLRIRVIVVHELPLEEQNAMLHLFAVRPEALRYGQEHYRPHSSDTSTLLYDLLTAYHEDPNMPEETKEALRRSIENFLKVLTPEERLKGLPTEVIVQAIPPAERLKGLSAEEIIKALPPEELAALRQRLKPNGSTPEPQ